jgi:hypothetical protein
MIRGFQRQLVPCGQCGADVETSIMVRQVTYCQPCRRARRRASIQRANQKAQLRRRVVATGVHEVPPGAQRPESSHGLAVWRPSTASKAPDNLHP